MSKATKTNYGLVDYCRAMLGQRYWNGTFGQIASEWLYKYNASRLPLHYGVQRKAQYMKDIEQKKRVFDCSGLIKGYLWSDSADSIPEYKANGYPDINEKGMRSACTKSGKIGTLPEVPGTLLFMTGHVGVYIGNGEAIEARGFKYGVVKTKVSGRGWTHWGQLKYIGYIVPKTSFYLSRNLRETSPRMNGGDVKAVQNALISAGYSCGKWGADGVYGGDTANAVRLFQKAKKLSVDGVVGKNTTKALGGEWRG